MTRPQFVWRSLQYVPTHVEKFVASAHTRGADAIILDLEDAVPPEEKVRARGLVAAAAERVGQTGADVLVRINGAQDLARADIEAAVGPAVIGLAVPKVESADELRRIADLVSAAEDRARVPQGRTVFYVLIESAAGLIEAPVIARSSPRIAALALGSEDFALDVGLEPSEETLLLPRQQLVIAAAAAGVTALGLVGVGVRFDDREAYLAMARRSRRFGFTGSSCIHPSQIPLLNEAFSPTPEELDHARRVVAGFQAAKAEGRAAFALDGRMIDPPIVARAEKLLARQAAIEARNITTRPASQRADAQETP